MTERGLQSLPEFCRRCGEKLVEGRQRIRGHDTRTGKPQFETLMRCPRQRWWHVLPDPHARKWAWHDVDFSNLTPPADFESGAKA